MIGTPSHQVNLDTLDTKNILPFSLIAQVEPVSELNEHRCRCRAFRCLCEVVECACIDSTSEDPEVRFALQHFQRHVFVIKMRTESDDRVASLTGAEELRSESNCRTSQSCRKSASNRHPSR